jgi:hypothetical protein
MVIVNIIYLTIILVLGSIVLKDYSKSKEVLATVDDTEIKYRDVLKYMEENHMYNSVNELVNQELIEKEAKKLNLEKPSNKILSEQVKYTELLGYTNGDLSNLETKNKVINYINIKELAKKYTINDDKLKKFLTEEQGTLGNTVYHLKIYTGKHDLITKIEEDFKNKLKPQDVEGKYNIKFESKKAFPNSNEFNLDLSSMKVGEFQHVHSVIEEHNHSDHEEHNHSDHEEHNHSEHVHQSSHEENGNSQDNINHSIVFIEKIEENPEVFSLEKNKDKIIDVYMSKNFYQERLDVLNYLRSKYVVDVDL